MNALPLPKRRAAICALTAVLAAAVAAPYLLPADPDSAVMRSGAFAAALLLACFIPARRAFERHSPRALGYGFAFALVFSLCLGVGSELTVYERLLPGVGSLVRRLAVPVLASPLLGALFSYLFDEPLTARLRGDGAHLNVPYIGYFLLFALCYGAVLLALFPGVVSYDFEHEIAQFTSGAYEAAHPVFHTLFLGALYALGEWLFGSMTAGAALYSAVQLLLLASMYAGAMRFAQRRVPRWAALALAACFALLPFHGVLAVSTAKDPLFSGLCALLCSMLWQTAEAPEALLCDKRRAAAFALLTLGLGLLRRNGVFAVLPACLALPALCRVHRRPAVLLAALSLALALLVPLGLDALLGAVRTPSSELMSVPCQQIMRTANRADVSEEEFAELDAWFSGQSGRYRPHDADAAKANFDEARFAQDPGAFWKTYIRYGMRYPRVYLEAFLENSAGFWNPGDTSHAHSLDGEDYDFVYLRTAYPYGDRYPIAPRSLFPALNRLLYAFMHASVHEKYAFLAQLFCPAVYSFGLLLTTLLLFAKRRRAFAACTLPLWGLLLSLLFSAGAFVRYAYPIMASVPVLLALALSAEERPPLRRK